MSILSSEALDQIVPDLVKAQADFLHVVKGDKVPVGGQAKAGFASFPAVIEMVRPILNRNNIFLSQPAKRVPSGVCVTTLLLHSSGQWLADDGLAIPAGKNDPQGHGSAISYAKRYGLLSLLGVATDDDDGAAALQGIEKEKREAAEAIAAAAAGLDERQTGILTAIAKSARPDVEPDLSEKVAEDFGKTVAAYLRFAVKENAVEAATAEEIAVRAHEGASVDDIQTLLDGTEAAA